MIETVQLEVGNMVLTNSTQRYLALLLMDMCIEHDLGSITVASLCRFGGVTRQTFYNHFKSMNEFIMFTAFMPDIAADPLVSFEEVIRERCLFQQHHSEYFIQLPKLNQFDSDWQIEYGRFIEKGLRYAPVTQYEGDNPSQVELRNRMVDMCIAAIFLQWWTDGMEVPTSVVMKLVLDVARAF